MPGAKKCRHALPALFFLLLFSPGPPGVEGTRAASRSRSRELRALQGERRALLDLLLRAVRDSSGQEAPAISSSRKRVAGSRHFISSRRAVFSTDSEFKDHFIKYFSETLARDPAVKDRILQFFTGSDALPKECRKIFYRAYYNTQVCSTPSLYQRCARMLARIAAKSPCI